MHRLLRGDCLNSCATTDGGTCDGNIANLSYSWDTIGNLTQRSDTIEGTTENFCYDALNRLQYYSLAATCSTAPRTYVNYSVAGNIQRKSDICTTSGCMAYGSGAGPHALTSITGTVDGIVNPTFTYDSNGNMLTGLGRTMTWTSYNMAATVSEGTNTLGFLYDPEHQRYKQCVGGCTSPTTTTLYLNGPASSEKVTTGSNVTWRDYIVADGGIVAERFNAAGTVSLIYVNGDHLGSTSVLTNASGAVVERDFYDPWGKRRNADGSADTACSLTSQTTRGYTSQEMMDSMCLENFNARLYDQTLGRFLSADSVVSDPSGQGLNRYSYTENNPLNAIDPSGHDSGPDDGDQKPLQPYDLPPTLPFEPMSFDPVTPSLTFASQPSTFTGSRIPDPDGWMWNDPAALYSSGGGGGAWVDYAISGGSSPSFANGGVWKLASVTIGEWDDATQSFDYGPTDSGWDWVPFDVFPSAGNGNGGFSLSDWWPTHGTLQIGGEFSGVLRPPSTILGYAVPIFLQHFGVAYTLSGGIAVDVHGNVAVYGTYGGGFGVAALGASEQLGVTVQVSNALTVDQLSGAFNNFSIHGGEGFGGSVDYFTGASSSGQVQGGGFTFGESEGVSGQDIITQTGVCSTSGGCHG